MSILPVDTAGQQQACGLVMSLEKLKGQQESRGVEDHVQVTSLC